MSDPVSAGASVLAFVLLSLKSAKVAHEILSSFKDAPDNVKRALTDVESLLLILERLANCRVLEGHGGDALRESIGTCRRDIDSFSNKLKSLVPEAVSSRRSRYWKRFMTMWDEKALSKMSADLASHTSKLNFHLAVLQSDAVVGLPVQLESMTQELTMQHTARKAHYSVVEEGITRLGSGFERIQETIQTLSSASAAGHLKSHSILAQNQIETRSLLERNHDETRGVLAQNQLETRSLREQTQMSHTETRGLLEQILQHVVGLSLGNQSPSRVVEVQDENMVRSLPDQQVESCQELMNIIARLCSLVDDIRPQGRLMPSEAQNIVDDLLQGLELMKSEEFLQAGVMSNLIDQGVCSTCCRHHLPGLRASLTTVYSSLWLTRQVVVNTIDRTERHASGPYDQSHSTLSAYQTRIGSLTVLSRQRSRVQQLSELGQSDPQSLSQLEQEEVTTSISLVSSLSSARHAIKISTRQTRSYSGVSSSIPHLLVNNVLPAGSPVFSIVRNGQLRVFQALLREGKASLRDHDEYGASLLFYANQQPEMCRYLIQTGADVDHIASFEGIPDNPKVVSSALYVNVNDEDADESLGPILLCRKHLLEAGCDPTLPDLVGDEASTNAFADCLSSAVPQAIQIMLDFGRHFVQANTKSAGDTGWSPLTMVCVGGQWSSESLAILLQRNADVTERDADGKTCLHHCLTSPWLNAYYRFGQPHWIHRLAMGIVLLIQHGADVYAEDNLGQSISDFAYSRDWRVDYDRAVRGAQGDVWDFALAVCGYDIAEFRQGRCREARYGKFYTKHVFDELWVGHEHLCPYYDVEEDWTSDEDTESNSDDVDEDEWATTDSEGEAMDVVDLE